MFPDLCYEKQGKIIYNAFILMYRFTLRHLTRAIYILRKIHVVEFVLRQYLGEIKKEIKERKFDSLEGKMRCYFALIF